MSHDSLSPEVIDAMEQELGAARVHAPERISLVELENRVFSTNLSQEVAP